MTGDGNADLLLTTAKSIEVLPGNGDGTFAKLVRSKGSISPLFGDFDGDGDFDLAENHVDRFGDRYLRTASNLGDGRFVFHQNRPIRGPGGFAIGDVNGDGRNDIVSALDTRDSNQIISTYLALPGGPVIPTLSGKAPGYVRSGAKGRVTVAITNVGPGVVTGPVELKLFISILPSDTSGTEVASLARELNLGLARSTKVKADFLFPTGLTPRNYFLVAQITTLSGTPQTSIATLAFPFIDG